MGKDFRALVNVGLVRDHVGHGVDVGDLSAKTRVYFRIQLVEKVGQGRIAPWNIPVILERRLTHFSPVEIRVQM